MRLGIENVIQILLENLIEFFYFIALNITQVIKYLACHGFDNYYVCTIFFAQLSSRKLQTFKLKFNNGF